MAFAQGSRSSLSFISEVTFGTTPAGNFTNLPFSTHSLNLTKDRLSGTDIQSDRMARVDRHGNRQVGGDIVVDLRDGDYDTLLESAMLNTFTTNVLKVGVAPKFVSIEDYAADIDQARLFTGMAVSTMGISLAPNQMVTTTFGMIGKDMSISGTEKTQDDSSGAAPFDAYSGALSIGNVGGATTSTIVTALDFTLTNSFAPTFVIGDDSAPSLEYGRAEVEGTLTAYFEDASLINRFLDETETEIEVSVDDPTGANAYTFNFPRVKINSADVGVDGPTSRMVTMSFVALYDSTEETNLKITRPA
ncbi:MAG: phage tail tube protein [Flavobacteriaceae bacterium]|nr:phage tail tube protein [Flavobacteriaceae bacterium]